ncbi:MAG TPA: cytidylate kinase-like family protein [Candidatus Acidoferrales bacterium]|nr:cytidylate kinase-like family protein [Candidatus Acidoferrales bacterium]
MIRVITITHQCGSGGTQLASLIARKFGWELLDAHLVDRIARISDLDMETSAQFDKQAALWWRRLRHACVNPTACCPFVSPRWLDEPDEDSVHDLAAHLIQSAADVGECVLVGRGAQCLLNGRSDVFNVLVNAPLEKRVQALQAQYPECTDVHALLAVKDSQRAGYIHRHYGRNWLDPMLYDLCVSTSIGFDRAATLINDAVIFPDVSWKPATQKEVQLCHTSNRH